MTDADPEDVVDPTWRAIEADRAAQAAALDTLADRERSSKVSRTVQQAGLALATVTVVDWLASFPGYDLAPADPASSTVPVAVVAAFGTIGAWMAAKWMNRSRG